MTIRLGTNPITWTNDDRPELRGDITLETCLAEARLAGYSGLEMGGKFPGDASMLRPLLSIAMEWLPASQEWRNVLHRR